MILTNVLFRVFRVRCGTHEGACFTLDHEGRQYIVSAQHVLAEIEHVNLIDIYHAGRWLTVKAALVGHANGNVDISVCALGSVITNKELEAPPDATGIILGQQVYFLGFPYGMYGDFPDMTNGYPTPFVKGAIVSMVNGLIEPMFLDGINNRGFSGGPVVWWPVHREGVGPMKIAGVISGYTAADEPVLFNGQDLGHKYSANTGLIKAYHIRNAVDIIEGNPIGALLPAE